MLARATSGRKQFAVLGRLLQGKKGGRDQLTCQLKGSGSMFMRNLERVLRDWLQSCLQFLDSLGEFTRKRRVTDLGMI